MNGLGDRGIGDAGFTLMPWASSLKFCVSKSSAKLNSGRSQGW